MYAIFYGNKYWDSQKVNLFNNMLTRIGSSSYLQNTYSQMKTGVPVYKKYVILNPQAGANLSSDSNIKNLIISIITNSFGGLTPKSESIFMLLLDPSNSNNLQVEPGKAFGSDFCGYHSFGNIGSTKFTYVVNGLGAGKGRTTMCSWSNILGTSYRAPNDNFVDFSISVLLHELAEVISDPYLNSWVDGDGLENGDKCNGFPGLAYKLYGESVSYGPVYNMILGSYRYLVQTNYDNVNNICPHTFFN
jgi:hypothetical protein